MEEHRADCPCKRPACPRHGNCSACRAYHAAAKIHKKTACERLEKRAERRADRSR